MINRFFNELTKSMPEASFLISPTGEIVAVNPSGARMLGAGSNILSGQRITDLVADPNDKVASYLRICLRSRDPIPGSLRWRTSDDRTIDCRCNGHLMLFDTTDDKHFVLLRCEPRERVSNKFIALNKTLEQLKVSYHNVMTQSEVLKKEIIERKKAEGSSRESQERFLTILNSLDAHVYVADMKTHEIIFVNKNVRDLFGDCEGKICWQTIQADQTGPCGFCTNNKLVDSGGYPTGPYPWEFRNTKTDRWYYIVDRALRWVDGRIVRLEIATDITERKKTEELIRNILESVDDGFIIIDRDYGILSANRAFAEAAKMPIEDIIGKHCYDVTHHNEKPCYQTGEECAVRKVFETGEPQATVHTHYDAKGNPAYIETKAYSLSKDDSGKVMTAIEILIDITEEKHLEEQLRQAQKMEAVGQLAGGVAHDFNNILTAIVGYGQVALMKMAKDDPLRFNIERMLEGADRAAHLTQSLLAFGRKQVMDRKPVDMNEIIKKVERFLLRIIGEDIEFKTLFDEGTVNILADSGQIEQVLMNFATNARDAMPNGGTFTIAVGKTKIDEEFIRVHGFGQPGIFAMITASDTGNGMDDETRRKIFEPFFTTKELGKGTGLGLAVVYGIIKQHNGYINVYSEPRKGTTFRIYLPVIAAGVTEEKQTTESELLRSGTETILLAEDDESVRLLERTLLDEFGYKVIVAIDGEDAVKKFTENKEKIQLLLFDLIMPKKSGKEAYDEIKKIRPDIKTIFLSGYSPDVIREKVMLEKEARLVFKPISPVVLLRTVRETLDQ